MRVLVCGTGFGRVYLEAIAGSPDHRVVGVLGRGSARSRAAAERYGVPLHTDVSTVGADVDLACVVVPGAAGGGPGPELARALLARGIPTLLEHPVHAAELAACLRAAAEHRTAFVLTTFYVHLAPVRRFLAAARELRRRTPIVSIDAFCAVHVAYDLLDIVGQALGGLAPWAVADPPALPDRLRAVARTGFAHRTVDAVLGGVPTTLRVTTEVDTDDPDHPSHLQHRVALTTAAGTLVLAGTHGPVLWFPAMHVPRDVDGAFAVDLGGVGADQAGAVVLGPPSAPSMRETFAHVWPDGVLRAVDSLRPDSLRPDSLGAATNGQEAVRVAQYQLGLSRLWSELTGRLGYPVAAPHDVADPVPVQALVAAGEAS